MQTFQSSWENSEWSVDSGSGYCAMTHAIPRFGQARFEQRPGKRLSLVLLVEQPPVHDQDAQIFVEAPPWKLPRQSYSLGDFHLHSGKTPLNLPREQALRIYYELEQGMQPVISFQDWGDGQDQVQVALLPVRFREALPAFLECTAGLLYLDFESLGEKTVYFATNSDYLSRDARRILEALASNYRQQADFRIVLGGHADMRGSVEYNQALSERRARMVERYLHSRGVPVRVIESLYFGESTPLDPAGTPQAWRLNRRVTVWLAETDPK
jgi:outer membrane protein OmpA-like peptidoglycan-associated protein